MVQRGGRGDTDHRARPRGTPSAPLGMRRTTDRRFVGTGSGHHAVRMSDIGRSEGRDGDSRDPAWVQPAGTSGGFLFLQCLLEQF